MPNIETVQHSKKLEYSDCVIDLVDDNPNLLFKMSELLKNRERNFRTYLSGEALLSSIQPLTRSPSKTPNRCVVSDVQMPGMDGIELLQRLHAFDPSIPVIIVTGHADIPLAVKAMREGAVDFIEKPYEVEDLIEAVDRALRGGSASDAASTAEGVSGDLAKLTADERRVVDLLSEGNRDSEIAFVLGKQLLAIESLQLDAMEKLGVNSLSGILRVAIAAAKAASNKP